jgi:DNA replication protein DnaC
MPPRKVPLILILSFGPTGVGKSFIACTLAQKACRDNYSAAVVTVIARFEKQNIKYGLE